MDYKTKYIKYKKKYLHLKNLSGGAKVNASSEPKDMPDNFIHVMSITKAVIGILYHLHEKDYQRDKVLFKHDNDKVGNIKIGDALNMNSKVSNNIWAKTKDYEGFFDKFMDAVDEGNNLLKLSKEKLNEADTIDRMDYNDLMYQVLASTIENAAEKFGEFMSDPVKKGLTKYNYLEIGDKKYAGWFREGKNWKWMHSKKEDNSIEPTGPNGIWMTKQFALQFGEKVQDIVFEQSKKNGIKVPPYEEYKFVYNEYNVFKTYWNGWWISEKCAYAIGHIFQCIALTPFGVKVQIYHDNDDNYKKGGKFRYKLLFIDNIEASLETGSDLIHLPGGKRSGLSKEELVEMVNYKKAAFYVDGADPDIFSKEVRSRLKPGYHIHKIFQKGEKFIIGGEEHTHEGSKNMTAYIDIIEDKDGKEWVIYDHNKDSKLDEHLINSF